MTRRELIAGTLVAVAMGLLLSAAAQAQPFIDDFEDGNASDGEPVRWVPFDIPLGYGTTEVLNGNLLLTPSATAPPISPIIPGIGPDWIELDVYADDRVFQDVSIHTQGRVSGQGRGWLGVMARDNWNLGDDQAGSVWGQVGIDFNGNQWIDLGGYTGSDFMSQLRIPTSLNFHETDVHLQLDVVGNTASLFAWADGEPKPLTPLLSRQLAAGQMAAGHVAVSYGQIRPPLMDVNTASFRFVEVVPEPLLGDVNLDGEVNGLDVDPFVDVLLSGPFQPEADMNDDQVVNGLDVDPFVAAVVGGVQQVPEPATLLLCLLALGVVGGWRKWMHAA